MTKEVAELRRLGAGIGVGGGGSPPHRPEGGERGGGTGPACGWPCRVVPPLAAPEEQLWIRLSTHAATTPSSRLDHLCACSVLRAGPCSRSAAMAAASFLEAMCAFPRLAADGGREGADSLLRLLTGKALEAREMQPRHCVLEGWAREGNDCWEGILLRFQPALSHCLKPPFAHPKMGKLLETVLRRTRTINIELGQLKFKTFTSYIHLTLITSIC
jgi:hypothetical protein